MRLFQVSGISGLILTVVAAMMTASSVKAAKIQFERTKPHVSFAGEYESQAVLLSHLEINSGFQAEFRIWRGLATGLVEFRLADGASPIRYEPRWGSVVPESETGPGYIVILMVPEGEPLHLENLAIATIRPDPALPGCDIWDFTSNTVSRSTGDPFHVRFYAMGAFQIDREPEEQ
jgi:hypothetical protein